MKDILFFYFYLMSRLASYQGGPYVDDVRILIYVHALTEREEEPEQLLELDPAFCGIRNVGRAHRRSPTCAKGSKADLWTRQQGISA
jgi:hypothetical protein